ncbi:AAA family ATPase [Chryseobacterium sp. SN22]|uniref:AAA family ATPase n=1 Tax=Chryseobacterium sp. SN22 TaxID=2606431 RepID=UPI0011EF0757|nr:AAA family ATPase [Chryseobacterium sp. SN22]KAA0126682.1 AAA family ATPase [Chryseobacterium sp. SN22]
MKRFIFPTIEKVRISHFSLYKRVDFLDIDLTKDVFCLAGANGLGKSTFITIINFGLTGIVKNPERRFTWYNEITKFYNQSKGFASTYFDGRVSEDDYELAEITIEFSLDDIKYVITRGFFEPDELRFFSRSNSSDQLNTSSELNNSELNDLYKTTFTKDVKLSHFDQFVFLQSFVFTFDETHQLLFWDESVMERVLYLFFGVDADKAKLADKYRKDYNKHDSDFRNLQWQITKTRNELNGIIKTVNANTLDDSANIELYEQHKLLLEKTEEINIKIDKKNIDLKDCDLHIADYSLKSSALRSEYESIFNKSLKEDTPIERNEEVIKILNDLKLRIYSANSYDDLITLLVNIIEKQKKEEQEKESDSYFIQLTNLDNKLSDLGHQISNFQSRKDRLLQEYELLLLDQKNLNNKIFEIEKENEEVLRRIHKFKQENNYSSLIKSYEDQILRYSAQKEDSANKRSIVKEELHKLEKVLNQGYVSAESDFIPIFNDYAKSFLGLEISIELSTSVKGANLSLHIQNSKRKDAFQLSESQRYFIDIALRMALIDLSTQSATLLIDTPEGSLDIAYESRAGKMLADFARKSHRIIMTANINSSQLLIELASICKNEKMKLERMTNWTLLSDVQQKESERIEKAYTYIETKLSGIDEQA